MAATTSKASGDTGTQHQTASKMKKEKLNCTSLLDTAVFLVPTAVGSYNTQARTLTNTRRSTVRGCHQGKILKHGCCTVAALPLTASGIS